MKKEEAEKAIKSGRTAGLVVMVFTTLIISGAILADASGQFAYFNDPFFLAELPILAILVWGVHKRSRTAAVLLLAYFVIGKIVQTVSMGNFAGVAVALLIAYYMLQAVRGTFAWHRIEREENPDYKPMGTGGKLALGGGVMTLLLISVVTLMMVFGAMPDTVVRSGDNIPRKAIDAMVENAVIYPEDEVLHYYSFGVTSFMEGGSLMTPDRVITYFPDETGELVIAQIPYHDITSVRLVEEESTGFEKVYRVETGVSDYWINIYLSDEMKGDERFVEDLRSRTIGEQVRNNRVMKKGN